MFKYVKYMHFSKNFHTINEEEEEYIEEYDSSDIDTSELTYVIEPEESQLKKEVRKLKV